MRPEKHQKIRRHQKHKHGKNGQGSTSGSKQKSADNTGKSDIKCVPSNPSDVSRFSKPEGDDVAGRSSNQARSSESAFSNGSQEESQSKSFSRRKIESNWSRYGDIGDLENERVMQRGADLNLLLAKEDDSSSQFRFQDELDWQNDEHQQSNILSLNVQSLVSQIQHLPISQRLDIDEKVFSIFESDFGISNISKSNSILPKNERDTSVESNISSVPVQKITIGPIKKTFTFSVQSESSDKTLLENKLEPVLTGVNRKAPVENKNAEPVTTGINQNNLVEVSKKTTSSFKDKTEEADDELDFLLALDNPIKTQPKQVDRELHDDNKEVETKLNLKKEMQKQTKSTESSCKDEADEGNLEDWLDSVLDN